MIVLLGFAFLAGAGTALSPCVLPVLPALLSAGGVGGRRRPLGIVLGLSITFTVTIVGVAKVVDGVGLGSDPLRDVAIVVLLVFGLALLLPGRGRAARGAAVAAGALRPALARRRLRLGPARRRRARLRLHARAPARSSRRSSPSSAASGRTVAIALAYALGSAVVLLALTLGGRRVFDRVRSGRARPRAAARARRDHDRSPRSRSLTNLDVNFDQFVAQHIPNVNLTASLECSSTVTGRLHQITGRQREVRPGQRVIGLRRLAPRTCTPPPPTPARRRLLADAQRCPTLGAAPEFTETEDWFNTPGGASADARLAARPRRARRLLDLHVHQLHPHAALPEGVGRRLPQRRPHDRRRRDARVRVRARRLQRAPTRSSSSACATRSSRTTTWAPGTPTATSTGPPTT